MQTLMEKLESEIPRGIYCNPDNSMHPSLERNCPYNPIAIYCTLHEEMKDRNKKICGINE